MANVMTIRGLTVDFRTARGDVHALKNVSIDVPENKILGVVGESGSGKSTLVWAAIRLLSDNAVVRSGEIRFRGDDVLAYSERQLEHYRGQQVSIVFQDPMTSQIPVITYGGQMADIQYRRRDFSASDKRQEAIRMLRQVGIGDPDIRVNQYPHQFSGGMRQRAGIAMALLMDPPLLIADEPTTALDVTTEAQIIRLMRELKQNLEATVVVVSHNLGLIAELCDEVVVMYAGEVVERGDVFRIFRNPQHPYTQALLECDPARLEESTRTLPTIPGEVPDLRTAPRGCAFAPRCPRALPLCREKAPGIYELGQGAAARCHLLAIPAERSENAATALTLRTMCSGLAAPTGPASTVPAADSLLKVQSLGVRFRAARAAGAPLIRTRRPYIDAVVDVSLSLRPGETLGLVGESGSGKTTLGRAILGLTRIAGGSVSFDGQELTNLSSKEWVALRRNMAMMFQDPIGSLSPRKTVRALIIEPLDIHGLNGRERETEAERLCDMVGLPRDLLSRYPHELSGGQARRVGVARALCLVPRLIIADEPTAGLDVSVQGEILNLMTSLQKQFGLTYLIITHNLPMVRHITDRLAIMYLGRIVEEGESHAVLTQPAHPYTTALVKGVPQPDPTKRRRQVSIEGEVPSLACRPTGCEFHPRCPYAQARCRTEAPTYQPISNGRTVRCHFPLVGG